MASEKLAGFEYAVLSRISDIGFLWEKTCKETSLILAAAVMTGCNGELEGVSATAAEEVGVPVDILLFFLYYNNSLIYTRAEYIKCVDYCTLLQDLRLNFISFFFSSLKMRYLRKIRENFWSTSS